MFYRVIAAGPQQVASFGGLTRIHHVVLGFLNKEKLFFRRVSFRGSRSWNSELIQLLTV